MHAVFLLVDGVVLLIDHDQAEVRVGQEQRRARADHDIHLARRDRIPGARALACAKLRMPFGRPHAEALREAVEELRGERNLGHQDQRLAALADRLGDRLEIDLGLARARDAVEQVDREAALLDRAAQDVGRHALRAGQLGLAITRIGLACDRLGRQRDDFQRAFVDQPIDHAGRDAGVLRGFGLGAQQAICERRHHAPARRRHALRRRTRKPHRDALALGAKLAHAQRHAQHHAARRQRVVRDPVDEPAQLLAQRRIIERRLDILQPVVQARPHRDIVGPYHADGFGIPERHRDEVADMQVQLRRGAVRIGMIERDRHQNVDDALCHAGRLG